MTIGKIAGVLAVVAMVGLVWEGVCLLEAHRHLVAGDEARAKGNPDLARLEWESGASRPAPFNRFASQAMERLIRLEEQYESDGRIGDALRVCFSIGAIAQATDGIVSWYPEAAGFAFRRAAELSEKAGVEFSPDRFTLFRPVRKVPAILSLLFLAGFVLAVSSEILERGGGRGRRYLPAAAIACFLIWLLLLRAS